MINQCHYFKNGELAWELRDYSTHTDPTGTLGVLEFSVDFTFNLSRVYFLRHVKRGETRGNHSHASLKQVIFCAHGSFDLILDSLDKKVVINMNADNKAVYVDGRVWRRMENFSHDAVLFALSDRNYSRDHVIYDYGDFKALIPKEVN
tara:strand:+ start:436 stop:879 length:444 start_codon:yes stop_codon:yes gene_type:complete